MQSVIQAIHLLEVFRRVDTRKGFRARFIQDEYFLTLEIVGGGSVTKDPDHDSYIPGDTVVIAAVPVDGWGFTEWSGDLTGNINPKIIVMNNDIAVTATFERTSGSTYSWGIIIVAITFLVAITLIVARKQIFSKKPS